MQKALRSRQDHADLRHTAHRALAHVALLCYACFAQVLTTAGTPEAPEIRVVHEPDIQKALRSRATSTMDCANNQVSQNDYVTVRSGPARGKGGTVDHVVRGASLCARLLAKRLPQLPQHHIRGHAALRCGTACKCQCTQQPRARQGRHG
jgi:hypothetical protein